MDRVCVFCREVPALARPVALGRCAREKTQDHRLLVCSSYSWTYIYRWFDEVHSRNRRTTGFWSYCCGMTTCTAENGPQAFVLTYYRSLTMCTAENGPQAFVLTYYRSLTMCTAENGPQAFVLTYYRSLTTCTAESTGPQALGLILTYYCGLAILCIAENTGPQALVLLIIVV